jgi:predicted RNA methylase
VPEHARLNFVDLGSGIGKLVLAAAAVFSSSVGIELAPERAAVASAALAKLGAQGACAAYAPAVPHPRR